jgi:hypothetical protein
MTTTLRARFSPGKIVATAGALDALLEEGVSPLELLVRHLIGDWGDLDGEDQQANERALRDGDRLLSAYQLPSGQRLYVITEWDRSATTILRVEDY